MLSSLILLFAYKSLPTRKVTNLSLIVLLLNEIVLELHRELIVLKACFFSDAFYFEGHCFVYSVLATLTTLFLSKEAESRFKIYGLFKKTLGNKS